MILYPQSNSYRQQIDFSGIWDLRLDPQNAGEWYTGFTDALPGHHAQPPEMFSEEYQAEMVEQYIQVFKTKFFVIGEHIWNLCDFKTAQGVKRANAMHYKGILTRDRCPKLVAHRLRTLWEDSASTE